MTPQESNRGWDYLNSQGESSYHSEDGSWGSIDASGEGSYHGSDGSWGRREKDGSISYHGADGSWGYRNKDGSGSYHGANGEIYSYEAKTDNDRESSADSNSLAHIVGSLIGASLAQFTAAAIAQSEREAQRKYEQAETRRAFLHRHWKEILGLGSFFVFIVVFLISVWILGKCIPMGYDVDELIGHDYTYVTRMLNEAGFTNIRIDATEDLHISEIADENTVYQIYVFGKNHFTKSTRYPYDTKITLKYHALKMITPPSSFKEMKGTRYTDLVAEFENAGFINIKLIPQYDIITGWLTDDGEVESVTIDGEKKYSSDTKYRPDAEVIITYHTYKQDETP